MQCFYYASSVQETNILLVLIKEVLCRTPYEVWELNSYEQHYEACNGNIRNKFACTFAVASPARPGWVCCDDVICSSLKYCAANL